MCLKKKNANLFSGFFCRRLRYNWGTVQVLTWMFQHKEQRKAWRKKPGLEYWFLFLSPLPFYFLSHAPLEADGRWWNGLLWSALPYRAATSHCPTVILGALQGRRWELLYKPVAFFFSLLSSPFCKESISEVSTVFWGEWGFSTLLSLMKTIFMACSIM